MMKAIRHRLSRDEGFTLIELMVVVMIIAVLIAIAIPSFLGFRKSAQDRSAQSELRSVFGYNSLAPRDHLALASSIPDPRSSAYDVLGTAFVISEAALDQYKDGESGLVLLGESDAVKVYRRPSALPLVRLLYQFEVIEDESRAISRVHEPDFDPGAAAIVDRQPDCLLGSSPDEKGTVEIVDSKDGYWKAATKSEAPAILVLAESAYPGWNVKIDGNPAEALTAYTTVKAVCVPAGEHVVEWSMGAGSLYAGAAVTVLTLIILIFAYLQHRKRSGDDKPQIETEL